MHDVAVIGLGIYGATALAALAERGLNVVGIDLGQLPNALGASHGASRIIRETTLESSEYVKLARESLYIWRQADRQLEGGLLLQTGLALIAEPGTHTQRHHGVSELIRRASQVASAHDIEHELLSGKALMTRYRALRVGRDASVFYEPGALIIRPEVATAYFLTLASNTGAEIIRGAQATDLVQDGAGLRYSLGGHTLRARRVVLATGPWQHHQLLPFRAVRAITYPQAVLTAPGQASHEGEIPPFVYIQPGELLTYAIPPQAGLAEYKVASEQYSIQATEPGDSSLHAGLRRLAEQARVNAGRIHPLSKDLTFRESVCHYTVTDRNRLVFKVAPQMPFVTVVSACSGHGFKYAPGIAERIAERLCAELRTR
jgi:glycine/D-amino acid oxidase-like deaminating enzyme